MADNHSVSITPHTASSEGENQDAPLLSNSPVNNFKELVERMEKANTEGKDLLRRHEELIAKRLIGGQTDATPPPEKKEETPEEYARRIIRGGK